MSLKSLAKRTPVLGPGLARLRSRLRSQPPFPGSAQYWDQRYRRGGTSGSGSYGRLAVYKADFLNDFVQRHSITSVLELGCGDGNQLGMFRFPTYIGVDVSEQAVAVCRERFASDASKRFLPADEAAGMRADLTLSLDVIYHLVEDEVFAGYMRQLFGSAARFVVVYASDHDEQPTSKHVRHRKFTDVVSRDFPDWELLSQVPNPYPYDPADPDNTSFADFFVFQHRR